MGHRSLESSDHLRWGTILVSLGDVVAVDMPEPLEAPIEDMPEPFEAPIEDSGHPCFFTLITVFLDLTAAGSGM